MALPSGRVLAYIASWLILAAVYLVASGYSTGEALAGMRAPSGAAQDPACPGETMPTPITGVSEGGVVSPEAMFQGQPLTGRSFEPGGRSYWHCHGGGQYIVVMDGTGRVQKRGERMRELHIGGIEFAGPGVEHWHGASPAEAARYINQGLSIDGGSGTYWMEEVTEDDYLGNDIGIASRTRFLETGQR